MYTPLLSPIRATCHAHLILFDFINTTVLLYFLKVTFEGDLFLIL